MMVVLEQTLIAQTADSTLSILQHGGKFLGFIIEDGRRDIKEFGLTRIPGETYELIPVRDAEHVKLLQFSKAQWGHEFILLFNKVMNFSAVYYHWGNFVEETKGCPLINATIGFKEDSQVYYGGGSRDQYRKFYNYIAPFVKAGDVIKVRVTR